MIGRFGIGFLSAFVVADRVEVRTRKLGEQEGWLWANTGSKNYKLIPCEVGSPGTTVTVFLKNAEDRAVIQEEAVSDVIRRYADMLLVPIHLNGSEAPLNAMHMPWEKSGVTEEELRTDCFVYLEKTMRDSVLEVIPIQIDDRVHASGVLYITRTRTLQVEAPRTLRVYQQRMFLCDDADILPRWLRFVNGVIDSSDLTPTAARDNFVRNAALSSLRDRLGDIVIRHLDHLHNMHRERFSQILRYHNLGIKAACFYFEPFFEKFAHLLEWRTNVGASAADTGATGASWRTLPEILDLIEPGGDGRKTLTCFTTPNSANQYFQMANDDGRIVVDASTAFEDKLIDAYSKLPNVGVHLVHVDREDDPNVFEALAGEEKVRLRRLTQVMSDVIHPAGGANVRVYARRFQPSQLAAVLRRTEHSRAMERAAEIISDPNVPEDLRGMLDELSRSGGSVSARLMLNAANPVVQDLSRQDLGNTAVIQVMRGLYNNAILYNAELMTPTNARILHDQFQEFMAQALTNVAQKESLERLEREGKKDDGSENQPLHSVVFMMTPFDEKYRTVIAALRHLLEERWRCQLSLAEDAAYEDRLFDNVRMHMNRAHAFVAEITEANPNVMFELGAAKYRLRSRPVVLLRRKGTKSKFPTDLQGYLYIEYSDCDGITEKLSEYLGEELRRHAKFVEAWDRPGRHKYLSRSRFDQRRPPWLKLEADVVTRLVERFSTEEAWLQATVEDVEEFLGEARSSAPALLESLKRE